MRQSDTPLLSALEKHREGGRFHMPGHKAKGEFRQLFGAAADFDVTELCYSDNLQHPSGAIAESERMTAGVFGAKYCLYSTQGGTLSAFCMLYAAKSAFTKRAGSMLSSLGISSVRPRVLISRDTHKSFYSACEVLGLEPLVAKPSEFAELASSGKYRGICAAVFTDPDYYGKKAEPIDFKLFRERGILTAVDAAHGAHICFLEPDRFREADFTAVSAHKFLPSFTQGAFLLVNSEENADECRRGRNLFGTTSPSYLVMAGIEYGVNFLNLHGRERLERIAKDKAELFAGFSAEPSDELRLVWNVSSLRRTGFEAEAVLNERAVYPEFADFSRVVFFFGLETSRGELESLAGEMARITEEKTSSEPNGIFLPELSAYGDGELVKGYLDALSGAKEYVPPSESAGRVSAGNVGFYPPATVFLLAGERISAQKAELLAKFPERVFGTEGGLLPVLRKR